MRSVFFILVFIMTVWAFSSAFAGEAVTYNDGDVTLEGYVAYPESDKPAPLVLIVHQWKGLGDYEKSRADMLAEQGYTAFAIDMYGQGIRPETREEAGAQAGKYKGDADLARGRLKAALDFGKTLKGVNSERVAIMGYCFGGTMALELARSGAPLDGTISFHGGLGTQKPAETGAVAGRIQVHHGAADPLVSHDELNAFMNEMVQANANMEFYSYPDAVHAFTEKEAGNDPSTGVAYNEDADSTSWERTLTFLKEVFKG